jgi:alpha-D-ribose 1-methylphosphonate 5-triphosphate synthase subunit PhnG
MNTAEARYEALASAPEEPLRNLADTILAAERLIEVLAGPEVVALPLRWRRGDDSHVVGHAVVTRCSIALGGVRGDGIRPGRALEAAVAAAVCDAEAERGGPLQTSVAELVADARHRTAARAAREAEIVRTTTLGQPDTESSAAAETLTAGLPESVDAISGLQNAAR